MTDLVAFWKLLVLVKPRSFNVDGPLFYVDCHKSPLFNIGHGGPYILCLPPELLQEIMVLVWASAPNEVEQISLMNRLPLVCKAIASAFHQVSPQDIRFTSRGFYKYYISRINKFHPSHRANMRCRSFRFYVDCTEMREMAFPEDSLAYFNNGKQFHLKGLFPNLTDLFINIQNDWFKDPYRALFPHFMPKTVKNVHIGYTFTKPKDNSRPLFYRSRVTPIRYPSTPHHLKRLTVSGVSQQISVARLWESLFKTEELIVDGKVLPVGEDVPWGLDMGQVCDMLQFGCRGIGWHWAKGRPFYPSDRTFAELYAQGHMPSPPPPVKHGRRELLEPEDPFRRIRRSKSFSHLRDSPKADNQKMTCPVMMRRKTFMVLPMIDYPYFGTE